MTGATTVLLALGPAVVTGLVGYLGAAQQATVALRAVEAENERLRRTHQEDERKRLFGGYHEFLSALYRLDTMIAGFTPLSKEGFGKWLDDFQRLHGEIELTGSGPVREAIMEVKAAIDSIGLDARTHGGRGSFERDFADAYTTGRDRLIRAVEDAIERMRTDVALVDGLPSASNSSTD